MSISAACSRGLHDMWCAFRTAVRQYHAAALLGVLAGHGASAGGSEALITLAFKRRWPAVRAFQRRCRPSDASRWAPARST